jgi:molybdopterin-guanine dinucleotide biosynthesis protein A
MNDVTGLILAGGRGERMGGADKGWVIFEDRPMIVSVIERLAPQVGALLISANRNIERYGTLATVVEDDTMTPSSEPFAGPLVGVLSGLRHARTEWVAIVPCDAPHLPLDLVKRLTGAASIAAASAACARVSGRLQPVFAVVRTNCTEHLVSAVGGGERAMHRWLLSVGVVPVDFDEVEAFANINTPARAS